jgi:hypothetical protein
MDLPEAIDDHQNVQGVEEEVVAEDVANNQVIRDRYHEHVAALNAIADAEENFLNVSMKMMVLYWIVFIIGRTINIITNGVSLSAVLNFNIQRQ